MLTVFVLVLQLYRIQSEDLNIGAFILPIILALVVEWGRFTLLEYTIWGVYLLTFVYLAGSMLFLHGKLYIDDYKAIR